MEFNGAIIAQSARAAAWRVAELNAARTKDGLNEIGYGMGLHLGDVTYGNIGSEPHLEFTVIGPPPNQAERIESLTMTLHRPILMSDRFRKISPNSLVLKRRHSLRSVTEDHELFILPDDAFEAPS